MAKISFGVSPAYHISRYSDRFTPEDVAASLADLAGMGFSAFQLEVFHPETLNDWVNRGNLVVANMVEKTGVLPSQFVGHFLLHGFGSAEALKSDFGIPETKACVALLKPFPDCETITVALPVFSAPKGVNTEMYQMLWGRFTEKLETMIAIAEDAGKRIALEIMPGSILGGLQGLVRLINITDSPALGYNFDTGHAWASREAIELLPGMLADRIFGTHLKDNCQVENLAMVPGRGTIPWDAVINNLRSVDYPGSWDLEIRSEGANIKADYAEGLAFIKSKLNQEK